MRTLAGGQLVSIKSRLQQPLHAAAGTAYSPHQQRVPAGSAVCGVSCSGGPPRHRQLLEQCTGGRYGLQNDV
jgi:hypothetical protein